MQTDIEIAQSATVEPIAAVAEKANIPSRYVEPYGRNKAKVHYNLLSDDIFSSANFDKPASASAKTDVSASHDATATPHATPTSASNNADGHLVLVSAINPTSAGEGKTTTTVGLGDALRHIGKRSFIALREPSLGPVFGLKGGAAGGGFAQVVPMEDINLHFTGDFAAISAANNLLCALIDNHIHHGNALNIDTRSITFKRVMDMNDRALRQIVVGLGGKANGFTREEGFDITAASEVMAILCLANDLHDLKDRLGNIVIGYTMDGKPVCARELQAEGAMTALLKDALKPNLVQTLEGTPAFVHGGPFANIAHGCNSVIATKMALQLGEYAVTEAGFGADLGAEKFIDITCRTAGLMPDACVIVATVRALKMHGGASKNELATPNSAALEAGIPHLMQHLNNMQRVFNVPCVVAINKFPTDTPEELQLIEDACKKLGVTCALSEVWEKGGKGGIALANAVVDACEHHNQTALTFAYPLSGSIQEAINTLAERIYHAAGVTYAPKASKEIARLEELGFGDLPICVAKTPASFSDDATLIGAPRDFKIFIRDVKVSAGAGFIVVYAGNVMTMPGLGKSPAALRIDVDDSGTITGLF